MWDALLGGTARSASWWRSFRPNPFLPGHLPPSNLTFNPQKQVCGILGRMGVNFLGRHRGEGLECAHG